MMVNYLNVSYFPEKGTNENSRDTITIEIEDGDLEVLDDVEDETASTDSEIPAKKRKPIWKYITGKYTQLNIPECSGKAENVDFFIKKISHL